MGVVAAKLQAKDNLQAKDELRAIQSWRVCQYQTVDRPICWVHCGDSVDALETRAAHGSSKGAKLMKKSVARRLIVRRLIAAFITCQIEAFIGKHMWKWTRCTLDTNWRSDWDLFLLGETVQVLLTSGKYVGFRVILKFDAKELKLQMTLAKRIDDVKGELK